MDRSMQDASVTAPATSEGGSALPLPAGTTASRDAAGVISALAAVLKAGRQGAVYPVALRLMAWVPPLFDSAAGLSSGARRLVVKLATRAVLVLCPSAAPGCEVRRKGSAHQQGAPQKICPSAAPGCEVRRRSVDDIGSTAFLFFFQALGDDGALCTGRLAIPDLSQCPCLQLQAQDSLPAG